MLEELHSYLGTLIFSLGINVVHVVLAPLLGVYNKLEVDMIGYGEASLIMVLVALEQEDDVKYLSGYDVASNLKSRTRLRISTETLFSFSVVPLNPNYTTQNKFPSNEFKLYIQMFV